MKEKYPDDKIYRQLYKRFLAGRSVNNLLTLAGPMKGKIILDLCGGSGRLSLAAIKQGCRGAILIDRELTMLSTRVLNHRKIEHLICEVAEALKMIVQSDGKFDYVFCQQAIN